MALLLAMLGGLCLGLTIWWGFLAWTGKRMAPPRTLESERASEEASDASDEEASEEASDDVDDQLDRLEEAQEQIQERLDYGQMSEAHERIIREARDRIDRTVMDINTRLLDGQDRLFTNLTSIGSNTYDGTTRTRRGGIGGFRWEVTTRYPAPANVPPPPTEPPLPVATSKPVDTSKPESQQVSIFDQLRKDDDSL